MEDSFVFIIYRLSLIHIFGLAISKHFIEESMAGEISLENYKDGVRCFILINEKEERHDR